MKVGLLGDRTRKNKFHILNKHHFKAILYPEALELKYIYIFIYFCCILMFYVFLSEIFSHSQTHKADRMKGLLQHYKMEHDVHNNNNNEKFHLTAFDFYYQNSVLFWDITNII